MSLPVRKLLLRPSVTQQRAHPGQIWKCNRCSVERLVWLARRRKKYQFKDQLDETRGRNNINIYSALAVLGGGGGIVLEMLGGKYFSRNQSVNQ